MKVCTFLKIINLYKSGAFIGIFLFVSLGGAY